MRKKRVTIENAKKLFEDRGYVLLEDTFKNVDTKMRYKCPKHPNEPLEIAYKKLKQGQGCIFCAGKKFSFDYVYEQFKIAGYELLELNYNNIYQKLRYFCPKHPDKKLKMQFQQLRHGSGCPHCAVDRLRLSIDQAKEAFESYGYELLENEYKDAKTHMRYRCPQHPDKELSITLGNLKTGYGCPYCGGNAKASIDEVRKVFMEKGYQLLDSEYKDAKTPLKFICPNHPDKDTEITFGVIKSGGGCVYCGGRAKLEHDFVKQKFEERGYKLLDEYKNYETKLKYKCPHHPDKVLRITYGSLRQGHGCVYCAIDRSSGENNYNWKGGITELQRYIRRKLDKWKEDSKQSCNYKCVVTGQEFDHIHHLKPFNQILEEALDKLSLPVFRTVSDYSEEELKNIEETVLKLHYKYPLGVCLKDEIHYLFHKEYGFGDTTEEQFYEFRDRYISGEFIEIEIEVQLELFD